MGSLLYYARAANSKLLVALSAITARQAKATVATEQVVDLLLDYFATYPMTDSLSSKRHDTLCPCGCRLPQQNQFSQQSWCSHLPFGRLSISLIQQCHPIYCPNHQFVITLAAKSELAALFITAKEIIPHRQTLIAMDWPQPISPIQTDNSTAEGVTNKTIVPHRSKMMDMQFWCLRCRASQDQFCYCWDADAKNWANYHTKHHPDTYHKAH